jgi:hypothetical protein
MKRMTITKDSVSEVVKSITKFVGKQVLIGIPESTAERQDEGPINNATIGYLMETGIPSQNVPARPWLVPGVKKAEAPAVAKLQQAADAALDGNTQKADQALNAAGLIGVNFVRAEIGSNIPPPLAPSTVRNRKYARGTKSRRKGEEQYLALVKGGTPPGQAQSQAGIVALVNTSQLRNSVTSVIRNK